ncbi:DUF4113 domain-containing protein [Pseudomonas sp. SWRI51]|uniref:Y-family DNA polymerase n=1 Tax=Pseudomonas sp. SWRI51 TaxID=2745491 RepID=UPI0016492A1A|nr:DUF4113 domain-containing protein [Pseudomonas sp. SWRI51]MBC3410588.1 DUF4113 domain-containing protein [Pseudomonas sp. SWRI51]
MGPNHVFYASCKRVFRPDLAKTPIVVLSNNDGCVIARSYDAKPFIKMGEPYFQAKDKLRQHGIMAFSSDYALYGDMSERVMTVIEGMVPATEIYSIDECFADLSGIQENLIQLGRKVRSRVFQCTGIPVRVGIAGTKTLAKLANHTAKRLLAQTGLRQKFSAVVEKTARELAGTPCLELDEAESPKHAQGALVELPYPTCDTLLLTRLATDAVGRIYRPGFRYSKAEVLLMDLRQPGEFSEDLFALKQPVQCDRLMHVMDNINERWGRGTMRSASVAAAPDWGMRREMMSQSHTTRINQLWTVKC